MVSKRLGDGKVERPFPQSSQRRAKAMVACLIALGIVPPSASAGDKVTGNRAVACETQALLNALRVIEQTGDQSTWSETVSLGVEQGACRLVPEGQAVVLVERAAGLAKVQLGPSVAWVAAEHIAGGDAEAARVQPVAIGEVRHLDGAMNLFGCSEPDVLVQARHLLTSESAEAAMAYLTGKTSVGRCRHLRGVGLRWVSRQRPMLARVQVEGQSGETWIDEHAFVAQETARR